MLNAGNCKLDKVSPHNVPAWAQCSFYNFDSRNKSFWIKFQRRVERNSKLSERSSTISTGTRVFKTAAAKAVFILSARCQRENMYLYLSDNCIDPSSQFIGWATKVSFSSGEKSVQLDASSQLEGKVKLEALKKVKVNAKELNESNKKSLKREIRQDIKIK